MFEAKLLWNKKNIEQYVKYTIFKGKKPKLLLVFYILCLTLIGVVGVISAIVTQMLWLIAVSAVSIILMVVYTIILLFTIRKYAAEILEINSKNEVDSIEITDAYITLKADGDLKAKFDWGKIASVDFNGENVYMSTINGLLFIIETQNIIVGNFDVLGHMVDEKLVKQSD